MPAGSYAKGTTRLGVSRDNSPPATSAAALRPGEVSPVSKLTVQSESVEASDIWQGHRDELAEKEKSLAPEGLRAFVAERAALLITDKIAEMLLYQKAATRLPEDMNKRIDAYVDGEIRKTVTARHDGMQRRYEKYLESQGTTLEQAKVELRRQFIVAGYLETEIRPKVAEPTRAELLTAFDANKDGWTRPARWSMSLIDIRVADLIPKDISEPTREQSAAARDEAHSKARAAWTELRNGAAFSDVARRYSHDGRAADGGAWGWVNPGSIRERYQPALDRLQTLNSGQVSDIIETPDGFYIVRCDEFEPAVAPDFLTVQPQLREVVFRRAYNRMVSDLVADLRSKARIEPANLESFHAAVVAAAFDRSASK
jgi:parvulin-like peptidyl-prolyl isomerase